MKFSTVCVDSNVLLNRYLAQPLSHLAKARWDAWAAQKCRIVAPPLLLYEITSVLRKNVYQRLMTPENGLELLQEILRLPIGYISPPDLHVRAYRFATRFNRPTAYDSHYLAVAETLGCEFWTADGKLANAVRGDLPWVKFLGDDTPS